MILCNNNTLELKKIQVKVIKNKTKIENIKKYKNNY